MVARARFSLKMEAGVAASQEEVQPAAQKAGPERSGSALAFELGRLRDGAAAAKGIAAAESNRGLEES